VQVPPSVLTPRNGPRHVVKDVLRIRNDLHVLDAQILTLFENPLMGKYTGAQLHAVVTGLEVAGVFNQFVGKIPPEGIFNLRGKSSCSTRVLPARAIDINLQSAQIERHVSTPEIGIHSWPVRPATAGEFGVSTLGNGRPVARSRTCLGPRVSGVGLNYQPW